MSAPSAADVEHAAWPALKAYATTLGVNPKGRSGIVRQRIIDHIRSTRRDVPWRAGKGEQAVLLTHLGFADVAVKVWEATISLDSPAPWVGLGIAYARSGMRAEAVKCFDRAIQMGDSAARLHKAHALVEGGASDLALQELDRAVAERPADARIWAQRAALLESLRHWDDAITAHRRLSDLTGSRIGLARALMKALRFDEAETALSAHLAEDPDDAIAWGHRGVCLAKLGRWKDALESLRRAASIDDRTPGVLNNLACVLAALGRVDEARKKLRAARRIAEDPRVLLNESILAEKVVSATEGPRTRAKKSPPKARPRPRRTQRKPTRKGRGKSRSRER